VYVDLSELQYNQSYKQEGSINRLYPFISRETPRVACNRLRVEDPYIIKLSLEKMKRRITSKTDIMNVHLFPARFLAEIFSSSTYLYRCLNIYIMICKVRYVEHVSLSKILTD